MLEIQGGAEEAEPGRPIISLTADFLLAGSGESEMFYLCTCPACIGGGARAPKEGTSGLARKGTMHACIGPGKGGAGEASSELV